MNVLPNSYGMNLFGSTAGANVVPSQWWPHGYEIDGYGYYRRSGMNTVRLPIAWESLQPQLGGALNATYLATLHQTVDAMNCAGLTVIIDIHNYAGYGSQYGLHLSGKNSKGVSFSGGMFSAQGMSPNGTAEPTADQFANLWQQLASDMQFKNNPQVVFDLMNEPNAGGGMGGWGTLPSGVLLNYYQTAIIKIRAAGVKNLILLESDNDGDPDFANNSGDELKNIVDASNNFAFEIHSYVDNGGTGTSGVCSAGQSTPLDISLKTFVDWSKKYPSKNFKAFLGEFGSDQTTENVSDLCQNNLKSGLTYINANANYFIGWTYWAGGFFSVQGEATQSGHSTKNVMDVGGIVGGTDSPQMLLLKSSGALSVVSK